LWIFLRSEALAAEVRNEPKGGTHLTGFWTWLEHTSWVTTFGGTGWMYASAAVVHYFSVFVLVGSIVLVDLRVLGLAGRRRSVAQFAEPLFPWMWTAFGLAIVSGFMMFTTDAADYFPDIVFRIKMTVILLALIFAIIVQRSVPKWDRAPAISTGAKLVALTSLILWIGAILAAVEIAAYSGLG
jgi:Family of unknown function (DUF6644)